MECVPLVPNGCQVVCRADGEVVGIESPPAAAMTLRAPRPGCIEFEHLVGVRVGVNPDLAVGEWRVRLWPNGEPAEVEVWDQRGFSELMRAQARPGVELDVARPGCGGPNVSRIVDTTNPIQVFSRVWHGRDAPLYEDLAPWVGSWVAARLDAEIEALRPGWLVVSPGSVHEVWNGTAWVEADGGDSDADLSPIIATSSESVIYEHGDPGYAAAAMAHDDARGDYQATEWVARFTAADYQELARVTAAERTLAVMGVYLDRLIEPPSTEPLVMPDAHHCPAGDAAEEEMAAWREILDGAKGRDR